MPASSPHTEQSTLRPCVLDTGCTCTITGDPRIVLPTSLKRLVRPIICNLAVDQKCLVAYRCTIRLYLESKKGKIFPVDLPSLFHPDTSETLICPVQLHVTTNWLKGSIRHYPETAKTVAFSLIEFHCDRDTPPDTIQCISVSPRDGPRTQYKLPLALPDSCTIARTASIDRLRAATLSKLARNEPRSALSSVYDWHVVFGHPGPAMLTRLLAKHAPHLNDSAAIRAISCPTCAHCNPPIYNKLAHRRSGLSTAPLQVLHVDLCFPVGLPATASKHGALGVTETSSVLLVIDDYSRYYFTIPLAAKSDAPLYLLELITQLERRFSANNYKVSQIICDQGSEFVNQRLYHGDHVNPGLNPRGIKLCTTAVYTPEQNGVAERAVSSLTRFARRLLYHSTLPVCFWFQAYSLAAILLNQIPRTRSKQSAPFIAADLLGIRHVPNAALLPFGSTVICFDQGPTSVPKVSRVGVAHVYLGVTQPTHSVSQLLVYNPTTARITTIAFTDVSAQPTDFTLASRVADAATTCLAHPETYTSRIPQNGQRFISLDDLRRATTLQARDWSGESESPASNALEIQPLPPAPAALHTFSTTACVLLSSHLPVPMLRDWGAVYQTHTFARMAAAEVAENLASVTEPIPKSAKAAFAHPKWRAAMEKEYGRLVQLQTFEEVTLSPSQAKSTLKIGCRWVFNVKDTKEGPLFKARLVAQGFSQKYGVHYSDTYSPVMSKGEVRTLIAMASHLGLAVHQMDVTTAFLYGEIDVKDLYLKPIPMFEEGSKGHLRLRKALYGLKQSPKLWYEKLTAVLTSAGYSRVSDNSCIFTKLTADGPVYLGIYVDDLIIVAPPSSMDETKQILLNCEFDLKDLGQMHTFLGMTLDWSQDHVLLHQAHHIEKMLADLLSLWSQDWLRPIWKELKKEFGKWTPKKLPMPVGLLHRYKHDDHPETPDPNRVDLLYRTVGCIRYLADSTRPDLGAVAMYLSTMMHRPREVELLIALSALCYLSGTLKTGIRYRIPTQPPDTFKLKMFSDASWKSTSKARSVSGHLIFLNDDLILWKSAQQKNVSLSAAEAELQSLTHCIQESVETFKLVRRLLKLCKHSSIDSDITAFHDNKAVLSTIHKENPHKTVLRNSTYYYWVRDFIENHTRPKLVIDWVNTHDNLADFMTKALPTEPFSRHMKSMNMDS